MVRVTKNGTKIVFLVRVPKRNRRAYEETPMVFSTPHKKSEPDEYPYRQRVVEQHNVRIVIDGACEVDTRLLAAGQVDALLANLGLEGEEGWGGRRCRMCRWQRVRDIG